VFILTNSNLFSFNFNEKIYKIYKYDICLALMFAFDRFYMDAFISGVPPSKLQHILNQKSKTYDYLFLGFSRTAFYRDCDLIEDLTGKSCINYRISGTTFNDSYLILQLMEALGIKFKNIFVLVHYMHNDTDYLPNYKARLLTHNKESIVKEILEEYDISFAETYIPFYIL
jgi:hypothetical protein